MINIKEFSIEKIVSWRSQYARMKRWAERTKNLELSSDSNLDTETLDYYLAFFLNCYALRDWFIKSNSVDKDRLDWAISENLSMGLCRDICNRSKHFNLSSPSIDADFSIHREYRGRGQSTLVILSNHQRLDLANLVNECQKFWDDFISTYKPKEPKNPFA